MAKGLVDSEVTGLQLRGSLAVEKTRKHKNAPPALKVGYHPHPFCLIRCVFPQEGEYGLH